MKRLAELIKKFLKKVLLSVYKVFTKVLPVNRNIIIFESNLGRNYTGNPKAVYEEMVRLGLDKKYLCIFILEDVNTDIPGAARKIKRSRLRYFYYFAVSGIWVCDSRLPRYIIKRPQCTYIQTWHGTPLKKLALDMDSVYMAGETGIDNYKQNFIKNTSTWDCLISQNAYSTAIFRKAFAFNKKMLEIGYPRNDILFKKNNKEDINRLKRQMGLPEDKKIILYAPTWRDNEFYGKGRYKFNPRIDFDKLMKELGNDYVMIVKFHYLVMDNMDFSPYKGFIYSYDLSYDINLLYLVADMLITDYSSVMFDYSLLERPMLFYCYDLNEYKDTLRGFYFDFLAEAPGPVVQTTQELISEIKSFDGSAYSDRYKAFTQKYNHADDGMASRRVIDLIEEIAGKR